MPRRAELFWSGSDRLLGPFSAAGAAGPDVTAAEADREPIEEQEEEAPEAESILNRCTRKKEKGEDQGSLTCYVKKSLERRDLGSVETINSSLQWLPEGPRVSRVPSGEEERGPVWPGN